MLYALGHVLHINQDMSQPAHTRNDNHYSKKFIEPYGFSIYSKLPGVFANHPHGWLYWRDAGFTKLKDFWDRGLYTGNNDALNADANLGVPGNQQLGLAEFSNGNYLSEDALYTDAISADDVWHHFPYPRLDSTNLKFIQYRLANGIDLHDVFGVTFLKDNSVVNRIYLTKYTDGTYITHHSAMSYLGVKTNPRAGAYGAFWNIRAGLTINDSAVLKEYHDALVPKAIEYSAGILDYFARGKVDTSFVQVGSALKLRITNRSGQALKGGTFEFFYDDAQGNRFPSTSFSVPTFDTISDGSSIDASIGPLTGGRYLLVYKGTIGLAGAVAADPVDDGRAVIAKRVIIPWAYYNLDALSTSVPDAISGRDLTLFGDGEVDVVPGKLGNCFALADNLSSIARFDQDMNFSRRDFTVRFWFRIDDIQSANLFLGYWGGGGNWKVEPSSSQINGVQMASSGSPDSVQASSAALAPGTWHHVIAWCRYNKEVGIRVDNGPKVVASLTGGFVDEFNDPEFPPQFFLGSEWFGPETLYMDEIAVWRDYVLSDAECTADWNNGNGRTWPW